MKGGEGGGGDEPMSAMPRNNENLSKGARVIVRMPRCKHQTGCDSNTHPLLPKAPLSRLGGSGSESM